MKIASSAREFERADRDAAGAGAAPAIVHRVVVGSGEAGDRIHQQEHILAGLDEAFGAFDCELGDAAVVARLLVVGACVNFRSWQCAAEFGDFLRAFIDKQDHEVDRLVVFLAHGFGHVEQEGGFARAWWRNDESALAATDGRHDIDDAGGEAFGRGFEADAFGRIDRLEFVEVRELRGFFGRCAVDGGDFDELGTARAFLVVAVDPLANAQVVFADAFRRDEDIVAGLFEIFVGYAQEAETFGCEFEHAIDGDFWSGENDRAALFEFTVAWFLVFAARAIFLKWCAAAFAFIAAAFAAAVALLSVATRVWNLSFVMMVLFVRCLRRRRRLLALIGTLVCDHASAAGHASDFAGFLESRWWRGCGRCGWNGLSGFDFFAYRAFF
jgi:hypothetical protein